MEKIERNSSFELLRIISIFGIIYMHSLGEIDADFSTSTAILRLMSDSLFNVGVSCFILISGFFGIQLKIKKLIRLDLIIIFYDIVQLLIYSSFGENLGGAKQLIKMFLPIVSRKYWFLSCYFVLTIFSPYINKLVNKMLQAQLGKFIIMLLFIFSVIPAFLCFEIMQDGGKGLIQMIIMYLVGRYIAIYEQEITLKKERLLILFVLNVIVTFLLNFITSIIKGEVTTPWARDCSIFIVVSAILLFLFFKQFHFYNKFINCIASDILQVYIFSSCIQFLIGKKLNLDLYKGNWYLFLVIVIYVLMIITICVLIEEVRKFIFGKLEKVFVQVIEEKLNVIYKKIYNIYFIQKEKIMGWLKCSVTSQNEQS